MCLKKLDQYRRTVCHIRQVLRKFRCKRVDGGDGIYAGWFGVRFGSCACLALCGEESLHQAFFVGLQGGDFLGLGGDQVVEGG